MAEALAAKIQRAVDTLPAFHQIESQDGELVDNPADDCTRLKN